MEFHDFESLADQIRLDMFQVVDDVAKDINSLIMSNVQQIVYDPYSPREYVRMESNGGFVASWTYDMSYDTSGNPVATIFSDPHLMVFDQDQYPFVHGKPSDMGFWGSGIDRRDNLDAFIAEGRGFDFYKNPSKDAGKNSKYKGSDDNWWTKPRDYFKPTTDALEQQGGKLREFSYNALRKAGIRFKY